MSTRTGMIGKVLSGLLLLGGVVLLASGGVAWNMTSSELGAQKIDISGVSYELDGKEVPEGLTPNYANGPFDALGQIDLIQLHTKGIIEGKMGFPAGTTYSQVPMPDSAELAACNAGKSELSKEECGELNKNAGARSTFDSANSKVAALFTSVLAFGVSALVMGLGIVLLMIGALELMRFTGKPATASESVASAA